MSSRALQTAVANTLSEAAERARRLESHAQDLERRIADMQAVMYEFIGNETRSEISSVAPRYCAPLPKDRS